MGNLIDPIKVTMDFYNSEIKTIRAKQYDKKSRYIEITCTNKGIPITLDGSTTKCYMKMGTPDERGIYNEAKIQSDGTVLVELTETALAHPGKALLELDFVQPLEGKEDGSLLSTMNLDIIIEKSVYSNDKIIASDEFNALTDLITKEQGRSDSLSELENSVRKAEEIRVSNETERCNSEEKRKVSEEKRETDTKVAIDKTNEIILSATGALETVKQKAEEVETNATNAAKSESNAKASEQAAAKSKETATEKADYALEYATKAQSYAVGGTNSREGEDTDNAQYYYEQVKRVSQGLNGIIPMGTVAFADLPVSGMENGWMYNVSDDFTSDDRFNDGGGIYYGKGNNIIWTSEGKWDVTAGSGVTGIKGNKEKTYRQGNVNLTPEQIGAVAEDGDTSNNTVVFNVASERKNIASGESHATLFGKIAKIFTDLKTVAFSGNYNDLSNKPTIPANTWRGIQNNLTSTSTTDSLAANQGRLLANGSARDNTKLPLSGGTVTGGITFNPGSGGYGWTDYYSNGSNVLSIFGQNSDGFVRSNANCLYLQCKAGSQGVGVQYNTGVAAPLYAASFTQNSSKRYKKNIQPISEARAKKILDMSVVTYDYIDGVVGEDVQYDRTGVIAEDTQGIIKEAVSYREINGKKVPDGVDYSKFVPYLIRMLQLQQEQIDELTARLR